MVLPFVMTLSAGVFSLWPTRVFRLPKFNPVPKTVLATLNHHFIPLEERDTTANYFNYQITVQGCPS